MKISVVIVTWEGREDLRKCLNSLQRQTFSDFEVIVVDNDSSDGTTTMLQREYPTVVLLEQSANLGFAEGCNRGIAVARGDWVATLNQDTVVDVNWLAALKEQIQGSGASLGMVQSRLLFMDTPDLINSRGIELIASGFGVDRGFGEAVTEDDRTGEIFCPCAGAALYRKSMLDQVRLESGYFDREFFMYGEDLDLGWRCRLAGWKSVYVPASTVHHVYQSNAARKADNYAVSQMRKNRIRVLLKNGSAHLILRDIPYLLYDLLLGIKYNGVRAIPDLVAAVYSSLRQRRAVAAMAKIKRADLEQKWIRRT